MRNLRVGIRLVAVTVFALLIEDFVLGKWLIDIRFVNETIGYIVMGLIFYVSVYFVGSESLKYFRLPRLHFKTGLALLLVSILPILEVINSDNVHLKPWVAFRGIIYLLAIGFGEEILSRGFVFGVLHKFGVTKAIFGSSLLFGLMHLNLYLGQYWDPWLAYWHVIDTFGFGILACALMIVTRSIWVVVVFHALIDWSVVFDKVGGDLSATEKWNPSFWDGLTYPFFNLAVFIGLAMLLLWLNRGGGPRWVKRLAIKWKLLKPEFELTA